MFDDFGKKAVIVTSKFAEGCENTGLRDVSEIFEEKGIEYKIIDYTMTNPPVENIKEMYEDTKDLAGIIIRLQRASSPLQSNFFMP